MGLVDVYYVFMFDSFFILCFLEENLLVGFVFIGDFLFYIILKKLLDFILKIGGGF